MEHTFAIPTLGRPVVVRPEDIVVVDLPLKEKILVVLALQLWASGGNLANRLEVAESDVNNACRELEKDGLIAGLDAGVTRRKTRRYILSRLGVLHVTRDFQYRGLLRAALPLTWQMTEAAAKRMKGWMPMVEFVNEILPTFWTSGLAEPCLLHSPYADPSTTSEIWLGEPTLTDVLWLPRGRLHVATTWRFDRYDQRPRYASIPIFWHGLLPQEDYKSRSLRLGSRFIRSPRHPGDYIRWDVEPPVVAIGMDQFAAYRARTAYCDDVSVGSGDTTGTLVWSAEASHSEWTLLARPQARTIGEPEKAATEEGPDLLKLGGIREYRIFTFVAQFRAATKADLVTAFRMSRGAATAASDHLESLDLIRHVGEYFYVTPRGLEMLAALHRVDAGRLVEVTYLDPEGEDAIRERRHDSAVAKVAAAFQRAGMPVAAGWRWVVSWDGGQLVPDLWVQVPVPGRSETIWVPVEVEFSAMGEARIEREKLRSYRLAPVDIQKTFPLLVITGEALAAERFDDLAGDLPMLTTTLKEFLTGVWEGPESAWRRKGRAVGLGEIAREHQAHLWQRTGKSVDFSTPSPEVWDRYMREESIWLDPQGEGLYGIPPIDPHMQAGIAPESTEAQAEPSQNDAATPPPTSPPKMVSTENTTEDRAHRRWERLRGIHPLIDRGDERAASTLRAGDLSEAERLCLQRVRAIIDYGASRHYEAKGPQLERLLKRCIELKETHERQVRSKNPIWWIMLSERKTSPGHAFRNLLGHFERRHGKEEAVGHFDNWCKLVDDAVRAARRSRTLDSDDPSGGSAA